MQHCNDPKFLFDEARGVWSFCTTCDRAAWAHEQADPLADIQNATKQLHNAGDLDPSSLPPVMKPINSAKCQHGDHTIFQRPDQNWWEDAEGFTTCVKSKTLTVVAEHKPMPKI